MPDTTRQRIVREQPYEGHYVGLTTADGEQHIIRDDLVGEGGGSSSYDWEPTGEPLLSMAQLTDFQLADLISPSRMDYLQRRNDDPLWKRMTPSYRPEEFLELHAIEGVASAIHEFADANRLDMAITTGDNCDSAQHNELVTYMRLLDGGLVDPKALGVGHPSSPTGLAGDPNYWHPDGEQPDVWTSRGLPRKPGAQRAASQPFEATGLGVEWLTVYGNHDALVQGRATGNAEFSNFVQGDQKPVEPPENYVLEEEALVDFVNDPTSLFGGESVPVPADPNRRVVDRHGYVRAHCESAGGHGFDAENLASSTAYYVWDGMPGVRIITLDTNNEAGFWDGAIDDVQFSWLIDRLDEVAPSSGDPRLVIIAAHHGLATLINDYRDDAHQGFLHLAEETEALIHKNPHVIAWISGHIHTNRVRFRYRPSDSKSAIQGGFVEIATAAVSEWPVQWRHLEISLAPSGAVIRSTIHDSAAPVSVEGWRTPLELASLHRAVAANDPNAVGGLEAQGESGDRNVIIRVPLSSAIVEAIRKAQKING